MALDIGRAFSTGLDKLTTTAGAILTGVMIVSQALLLVGFAVIGAGVLAAQGTGGLAPQNLASGGVLVLLG